MGHQATLDSTGRTLGSSSGNSMHLKPSNATMDSRERTAREFFAQKALLPNLDQTIKKADIYQAILGATKWPRKDQSEHLVKAIEHMVVLLRKMDEEETQGELIKAINTNIMTAIANANIPSNAGDQLAQLRDDLKKEMGDMLEKIQKNMENKLALILAPPKQCSFVEVASSPPATSSLTPAMNQQ